MRPHSFFFSFFFVAIGALLVSGGTLLADPAIGEGTVVPLPVGSPGGSTGHVRVAFFRAWLDVPVSVREGVQTVPAGCPDGWRLPSADELRSLVQYGQRHGGVEPFLRSFMKLGDGERILITSTKAHPDAIDGKKNESWEFLGWDRKRPEGGVVAISTFAVVAGWNGYNKGDLSARCILGEEPIAVETDPGNGLRRSFRAVVPGAAVYTWDFGDGPRGAFASTQAPTQAPTSTTTSKTTTTTTTTTRSITDSASSSAVASSSISTIATGNRVTHNYTGPGAYEITLTVQSMEGDREEFHKKVRIREPYGSVDDLRTIPRLAWSDPGIKVQFPRINPYGHDTLSVAPLAVDRQGTLELLAGEEGGVALYRLTQDGKVLERQELGTGIPGSLAVSGERTALLTKEGENRAVFRVLPDGKPVVLMDNEGDPKSRMGIKHSGRGYIFRDSDGKLPFGTQAMFQPFVLGRVELLPRPGGWFATFSHCNNFNASPVKPGTYEGRKSNFHCGELVLRFDDSRNPDPELLAGWNVSHSMDRRAFCDDLRCMVLSAGDAYPTDLRLQIWDARGGKVAERDLFASLARSQDLIGNNKMGATVYGVAGGPSGVAIRLGEVVSLDENVYGIFYALHPGVYPNKNTAKGGSFREQADEMGLLIFDASGKIRRQVTLRRGADVRYLHSIRLGRNFMVAFRTEDGFRYIVVDREGRLLTPETPFPQGGYFNASDSFVLLPDGDILWTAAGMETRKEGDLRIFRIHLVPVRPLSADVK